MAAEEEDASLSSLSSLGVRREKLRSIERVESVALEREGDAKERMNGRAESPGDESPGTVELSDVAADDGSELIPADSPRSGRDGVTAAVTAAAALSPGKAAAAARGGGSAEAPTSEPLKVTSV